jgi:hypothetical protein
MALIFRVVVPQAKLFLTNKRLLLLTMYVLLLNIMDTWEDYNDY